jgi:amidase
MKRWLLSIVVPIAALSVVVGAHVSQRAPPFEIIEATIPDIQDALRRGDLTSRDLVEMYLTRIERYEPLLNAVITINPRARSEAETLDAERAKGLLRGPLHGIPIAIKDNINTTGMPTTAGALSFAGYTPPYEATLVTNLHRAGAIIIAKTVLTEFANFMSFNMPANYSAVGGYGMNPYDPRPDPRAGSNDGRPALGTGGSSSGIGTAANLWVASVGTETNGSILSPSVQNMLVGIKPTVGLISRYGILPLTADQDTAGPMARTVTDAAILLGAMTGPDPRDSPIGTHACGVIRDYTSFLRRAGLQGARIGIPRANYYNPVVGPDGVTRGGLNAAQQAVMNEAIQILRQEGAILVDPADIPSIVDGTAANNLLLFPSCTARATNCSLVS